VHPICLDTIMPDRFHARFELPAVGSLPVTLTANGDSLSFIASHTPYDSLSDLVTALISIVLTSSVDISVRWNTEPVEYEFRFATEASILPFMSSNGLIRPEYPRTAKAS
jgi:hypothetical protein